MGVAMAMAPDAAAQYAVRVRAMGVMEPVSIRLEVPGGEELVSVRQDGESVFDTELEPGDSYLVELAGEAVAGGEPSNPIALGLGETAISVVVTHPPSNARLTYEITVDRAGNIIQQAYAKASNSDADDFFGGRVALSANGDTLAVGADWEDSAAMGIGGDQDDNTADKSGAVYIFR